MSSIREISRIISLDDDERKAIRENEDEFSELMDSLEAEYRKFEEFQVRLKKLALRFNDDSYKKDFAAKEVLKSLEQLKSVVQELKSKNAGVDPEIDEKIIEISKKYGGK